MSFLAEISEAVKPQPFTLTTMGGRVIYIAQMTARQVAQWWLWVYENPAQKKMYDEQLVELFVRLAVDKYGTPLVAREDAGKLRELTGSGAVLAEFWTEAKRRNMLYQTTDEEQAARDGFFIKHPQLIPSSQPSDELRQILDAGTGSASPTN